MMAGLAQIVQSFNNSDNIEIQNRGYYHQFQYVEYINDCPVIRIIQNFLADKINQVQGKRRNKG